MARARSSPHRDHSSIAPRSRYRVYIIYRETFAETPTDGESFRVFKRVSLCSDVRQVTREVTRSVAKLDWLVEVHIVKLNLPYLTSPYKYYILIRRFSERARGKNKCGERKKREKLYV